jgi:hypothetical protein
VHVPSGISPSPNTSIQNPSLAKQETKRVKQGLKIVVFLCGFGLSNRQVHHHPKSRALRSFAPIVALGINQKENQSDQQLSPNCFDNSTLEKRKKEKKKKTRNNKQTRLSKVNMYEGVGQISV